MHLSVSNLSVSLDKAPILRDVSFEIARGESVGLVGPNGSGKSTLMRSIAGLLPYEGEVHLGQREMRRWKARELAQRLAFLRQNTSVEFDFTVEQFVLLGRTPHRGWLESYRQEDRVITHEALRRVELEHLADRSVLTLSGGELQRAFLAQALVQEAGLLLLDEPTAHLDVHHRFEFLEIVQQLAQAGRTVITAFHDLETASRFTDRLLVLERGRLVGDGAPIDVLTEDLLAGVFRMRADVRSAPDDAVTIHFHGRMTSEHTTSSHENLYPNRR